MNDVVIAHWLKKQQFDTGSPSFIANAKKLVVFLTSFNFYKYNPTNMFFNEIPLQLKMNQSSILTIHQEVGSTI
jgi:hypothetical protein